MFDLINNCIINSTNDFEDVFVEIPADNGEQTIDFSGSQEEETQQTTSSYQSSTTNNQDLVDWDNLIQEDEHLVPDSIQINGEIRDNSFLHNDAELETYLIHQDTSADDFAEDYTSFGYHYEASLYEKIQGHAPIVKIEIIDKHQLERTISADSIAQAYALTGNSEKVDEYLIQYPASASAIAKIYAYMRHDDKVEELRIRHKIPVIDIARYYALANNYDKVEEYRKKHKIPVKTIVQWYAYSGNHKMVEEYRTNYAVPVNLIVYVYARAGNHAKVREYMRKYQVSLNMILEGYIHSNYHDKVKEYHNRYGNLVVGHIIQCYHRAGNELIAQSYEYSPVSPISPDESTVYALKNGSPLTFFAPVSLSSDNIDEINAHIKRQRNS